MLFSQAIAGVEIQQVHGPDTEVHRVTQDSRKAAPGAVFVAMRGDSVDGNQFIEKALQLGASSVVTDSVNVFQSLQVTNPEIAVALCSHGRKAAAGLAANLYGHPERSLQLTGVTGTNGKTTTAFLLEAMLRAAHRKTMMLGTIEIHLDGKKLPAEHTTPEADALYSLLSDGVGSGVGEAVMEVSSHALEQARVWGLQFDVAVFTNLTQDHLDFHGSMDAYLQAKKRLFISGGTGAASPRVSVINVEDGAGRGLLDELRGKDTELVTYGITAGQFHAADLQLAATGSRFTLCTPAGEIAIETSLAGRVNVGNVVAAAAAAIARGVSLEQIATGVRRLRGVPGRFQQVESGQPFAVVVDYAHTDDALRRLAATARELIQPGRRVITVFGCGGDRDRSKRPLMAKAAAGSSDLVILTSDNPRSEDPAAILRDAEAGLAGGPVRYSVIADRRTAIAEAVAEARAGDIVLLAGKGHEKTQTTREGVFPFDDVAVAQSALNSLAICN